MITPCYLDRAPFMELLTAGVCKHELLALYRQDSATSSTCDEAARLLEKAVDDAIPSAVACSSLQGEAKTAFDNQVVELFAQGPRVDHLRRITGYTLNNMTLTYMEALDDIRLGQAFLWLQEKAILSDRALLCNTRPGMRLRLLDLVRNLLLSVTMNLTLSEQEEFYQQRWLQPLEHRLGVDTLDRAIAAFVASHCQEPKRHISDFEHQVNVRCQSFREAANDIGTSVAASKADHGAAMQLYAQFYSLAEACQLRKDQPKALAEERSETTVGETASKRARRTLIFSEQTLLEVLMQLTAFTEDYMHGSAGGQSVQP